MLFIGNKDVVSMVKKSNFVQGKFLLFFTERRGDFAASVSLRTACSSHYSGAIRASHLRQTCRVNKSGS
ncbi:MAG: hypothetical protein KKC28_08085 [Verrucomicrobia bacterium]|nr:hypothetical protein [Verrucomicrobiota bacterium]